MDDGCWNGCKEIELCFCNDIARITLFMAMLDNIYLTIRLTRRTPPLKLNIKDAKYAIETRENSERVEHIKLSFSLRTCCCCRLDVVGAGDDQKSP